MRTTFVGNHASFIGKQLAEAGAIQHKEVDNRGRAGGRSISVEHMQYSASGSLADDGNGRIHTSRRSGGRSGLNLQEQLAGRAYGSVGEREVVARTVGNGSVHGNAAIGCVQGDGSVVVGALGYGAGLTKQRVGIDTVLIVNDQRTAVNSHTHNLAGEATHGEKLGSTLDVELC
jgi:hypothetical protein